jgi:hypothetical protein
MLMPESLTLAGKIFKRNTRNSMFRHVVFLEPASSTHSVAKIQTQTQETKGKGSYEAGYTKNTLHQRIARPLQR